MTTWRDSLRPASWRNLPFKVMGGDATVGRRVHLHEYPFRDDPWAEDLGRRARNFTVRGFLVGDDVAEQLRAFEEAAETAGSGDLVHPFRGSKTVTLLTCGSSDAYDEGRVVRLILEFVEVGERRYPSSATSGAGEVGSASDLLDKVAGDAGLKGVTDTVRQGYAGVQSIVKTAQGYVSTARSLVSSATGALRSVTSLASIPGLGNLGRFVGGFSLSSLTGASSILGRVTSLSGGVSSALSRFNAARTNVTRLGDTVMSLARRL